MTNHSVGHEAEKVAAQYLKNMAFTILDLNWRTRFCEIDIVAESAGVIYFIEVKYRRTSSQGGGLDYITPKKLKQMDFAAQCWVSENRYTGDYELSAIEVTQDFKVSDFIQSIS